MSRNKSTLVLVFGVMCEPFCYWLIHKWPNSYLVLISGLDVLDRSVQRHNEL